MNVKAMTVAFALASAFFFCIYASFVLMIPMDYQSGLAPGSWFPVFHTVTPLGFLLGMIQAAVLGALLGLRDWIRAQLPSAPVGTVPLS